ncbi:Enoyl reductase domain of yeast-type FAS1 [Nocardia africana]|uniref:Enoyl reductase domain of yeast-type FAS1 n=1 Tax=Nocardia africana TaxID=134964 RepID=A0A378X427_9NOCA|nr:Enoyl reductase domain of yeast-type FAS1 [Nocardia africana]
MGRHHLAGPVRRDGAPRRGPPQPADRGRIPTLFDDDSVFERPVHVICTLKEHYPAAADTVLHPADVPFFVSLCKTPASR